MLPLHHHRDINKAGLLHFMYPKHTLIGFAVSAFSCINIISKFSKKVKLLLVGVEGIEPPNSSAQTKRHTTWLHPNIISYIISNLTTIPLHNFQCEIL